MVYHCVVYVFCSMYQDRHYRGVRKDGLGVPDLVIGEQSRRAEHDAFIHPDYLLLSRLGEPNAVEECGIV